MTRDQMKELYWQIFSEHGLEMMVTEKLLDELVQIYFYARKEETND